VQGAVELAVNECKGVRPCGEWRHLTVCLGGSCGADVAAGAVVVLVEVCVGGHGGGADLDVAIAADL
jgi:hypothetical protein